MEFYLENILKIADKFGVEKVREIAKYVASNQQATTLDEIPEGSGKFGFDKENPIPIFGIPGNEIYLRKLRLVANNEKIKWKRTGSVFSKTINYPIDEYRIFDCENNFISFLYFSSYHWRRSDKIPDGFSF
ncbi:MAG: hypothetical protein V4670_02800 [Bacteroidota bacterium]